MNDARSVKKEKYQHIQVYVRVRPINNTEQKNKFLNVVEVPNDKEVIVHEQLHEKFTKKFKFDNVFGPSSKQIDVYNVVVNPLLDQVLAGYNCTIFAYGQTGTGKTFTMEGINSDPTLHWQSDSSAGMIPRSINHLFEKLQLQFAQGYTVRISFLEIYNEDLFDLLAASDDTSKIRLYEDASKKGSVIIHGLTEVTIRNKSEVNNILGKGIERRQTAATLMNAQSSRSHTVFSITIHMKENTVDGEEVLKTGKLNLVDLAGSENVGKSGAVDRRAREAGSINQSLLTLGRVITALVERAPHIPYRESKLTRLLQESLGGRTKTSIIATISPDNINIEETLSTLDYAHRAKNITNRPEINQKLSKRQFLKQYTEEIERLQRDLLATREKNGVYIANDNYNEMQALISQQTKEIEYKINHIKALEETMKDKEKVYNDLVIQNMVKMKQLHESKMKLNNAVSALKLTEEQLKLITKERDEQKYLVDKYKHTEQLLLNQAQTLLGVADVATADSYKLHEKIERKNEAERALKALEVEFKNNISECLHEIQEDVSKYTKTLQQFGSSVKSNFDTQFSTTCQDIVTAGIQISTNIPNQYLNDTNKLTETMDNSYSDYQKWIQNAIKNVIGTTDSENKLLNTISAKMAQGIEKIIENEVANSLIILRNQVSDRLQQTSTILKDILDSACTHQLETYNSAQKNVDNIIKDIEALRQKQKCSEKQQLLTNMMADVFSQFNTLNKSQDDYCSMTTNECDYVTKVCNEIHNHTTRSYNTSVITNNNLQVHIENGIRKINNDVTLETKLNEDLEIKNTEERKSLMNVVKSDINESCRVLKQYRNCIEDSGRELQSNINTVQNEAPLLISDEHKKLLDISKNHVEFIQDKKVKICEDVKEISTNFDRQIAQSCMSSECIVENLQKTANKINEFFDKDIQRDVPTGSTPTRKEFSYPRQFKVTSPHERILQRFRETRKMSEFIQEDVINDNSNISSEMTMNQCANSTTLFNATIVSTSQSDNTIYSSALENDFTLKYTNSCNSIMESDIEDT